MRTLEEVVKVCAEIKLDEHFAGCMCPSTGPYDVYALSFIYDVDVKVIVEMIKKEFTAQAEKCFASMQK
jgi:hypothetical protein